MWIDPRIVRTQNNYSHLDAPQGGFQVVKHSKSGKCHELPRKSIKKLTPTAHPTGVEVLGVNISKGLEIS